MKWWSFKRYQAADGRDLVREWYDASDEQAQSDFGTMTDLLESQEDWFTDGPAKTLRNYPGLCEIVLEIQRYEIGKRGRRYLQREQHRIVGFIRRYPERAGGAMLPGEFVLLNSCLKSGGRYTHVAAFDEALRLRNELEQLRGTLNDHIL